MISLASSNEPHIANKAWRLKTGGCIEEGRSLNWKPDLLMSLNVSY